MTRLADRPASQPNPTEPSPSPRKVYDRSSFEGDFLVAIPDQSPDDFERFAPETRYCEYFDGTVYMPSPVSNHHQRIVGFLYGLLDGYRWNQPPGLDVLFGPAVLRLTEDLKPEPDLFVAPLEPGGVLSFLVIEVISASHRSYDLAFKAGHYQAARVPEIWYIDHANRTLVRDLLSDTGYSRQEIQHGRIAATQLPGFWIEADWLWADPLPNPRLCLEEVLADPLA